MSFVVPSKDFKVVYYDKYSGLSVTRAFTLEGFEYLTKKLEIYRERTKELIEKENLPTFVILGAGKSYYLWCPTLNADFAHDEKKQYKVDTLLADHPRAIELVKEQIIVPKEKKKVPDNSKPILVISFSSIDVYHGKTFEQFTTACAGIKWFDNEAYWKQGMSVANKRLFVIHANKIPYALCIFLPNDIQYYDASGKFFVNQTLPPDLNDGIQKFIYNGGLDQ